MTQDPLRERLEIIADFIGVSKYDHDMKHLLNQLTTEEIKILADSPDLFKEIRRFSAMEATPLIKELQEKMEIEVKVKPDPQHDAACYGDFEWPYDEYFMDNTKNMAALPSWARIRNFNAGVWKSTEYKFRDTARRFLLRRVRLNLWLRAIQEAQNPARKKEDSGNHGSGI